MALDKYTDDEKICFILGYTLNLHWFYLDETYSNKGKELMKRCVEIATKKEIKTLAEFFLANKKGRKSIDRGTINETCKKLFPSDSVLDSYFKEVFTKTWN